MNDRQTTITEFEAKVTHYMKQFKCGREKAVEITRRRHPDLAKAFVVDSQRTVAAKRRASEMYDGLNV